MSPAPMDMRSLPLHAARLLGATVTAARPLGGGDLSEVVALTVERSGEAPLEAVAKTGPFPRREARMLESLGATGTPVPTVLAADDTLLILQRLPVEGTGGMAWAPLGRVMRHLHDAPCPADRMDEAAPYGWIEDYAFGALPIVNHRHADWITFWRDERLLCHVPHVAPPVARGLERLAARLGDHLPARPRPSLLHGDLWSGNILATGAGTAGERIEAFIDPACCIGHAEADFAILTLFAQPTAAFWSAYGSRADGWAERLAIYQLWPALVHLRLFGQSYRPMVERLLASVA